MVSAATEGRLARASVTGARHVAQSLSGVVLMLVLWEFAPRLGIVSPTAIPAFSDVLSEVLVVVQDPQFMPQVALSARRWVIGLMIASFVGVAVGVLMARSRVIFTAVDPLLALFYTVPKVSLVLMLVVWLGANETPMVVIIALGCLIPIVISSYHGAHGIEPRLLWSARSLGTSRLRSLYKVVLPAAVPQILSGFRIAIAFSLFTMLASELLIRRGGLGSYLFTNFDNGDYLRVWATSVLVAMVGFALDGAYSLAVRKSVGWLEGEV